MNIIKNVFNIKSIVSKSSNSNKPNIVYIP